LVCAASPRPNKQSRNARATTDSGRPAGYTAYQWRRIGNPSTSSTANWPGWLSERTWRDSAEMPSPARIACLIASLLPSSRRAVLGEAPLDRDARARAFFPHQPRFQRQALERDLLLARQRVFGRGEHDDGVVHDGGGDDVDVLGRLPEKIQIVEPVGDAGEPPLISDA
jgi:hypothetical protein